MNTIETFRAFSPLVKPGLWLPTHVVADASSVGVEWFRDNGIKGAAYDLDGTLEDHDAPEANEDRVARVKALRAAGIVLAVLSNVGNSNKERNKRVEELAAAYGIDIIVRPIDAGGLKKPHPVPFETLALAMGLLPEEIAYFGDQAMKDIVGANRAGYGASVLVPRLGPNDDKKVAKWQRWPEEKIRQWQSGVPNEWADFPAQITATKLAA